MKFYSIILLVILTSCGEPLTREDLLPNATGAHGEIILLMEDDIWTGKIGETVSAQLDQNAEGPYLRPEPMFSVFRKRPAELNHLSQLNRNILKVMVDFDSTYKETAVLEKRNYFAKNQLFVIIKDSDPNRLYQYCQTQFSDIIKMFNDFELEQLTREYTERFNENIKDRATKNFGISICLPKESELKVDSTDFMWVKRDRSKQLLSNEGTRASETYWIQQGIVFWSQPYSDTSQLTIPGVLRTRDTILKYNIPGKVKNSYMATEYDEYYKPEGKIFEYHGAYAVEIRGLWVHRGDPAAFGGGPFVQYSIHNEKRGTIVTVCGYIYAPKFDKREYIREIDAMLNTIELVD